MMGVILIQNGDMIKKIWKLLNTCFPDRVRNNLDHVENFSD